MSRVTPDERLAEAVRKLQAREKELDQYRQQLLQQRTELQLAADSRAATDKQGDDHA